MSVHCQFVCIEQNDALENVTAIGIDVGFRKEFQFISNEFDAFAVCTIHIHDQRLDFLSVIVVDIVNEFRNNCSLSRPRRTMKYDVWDFMNGLEICQLFFDWLMNLKHYLFL